MRRKTRPDRQRFFQDWSCASLEQFSGCGFASSHFPVAGRKVEKGGVGLGAAGESETCNQCVLFGAQGNFIFYIASLVACPLRKVQMIARLDSSRWLWQKIILKLLFEHIWAAVGGEEQGTPEWWRSKAHGLHQKAPCSFNTVTELQFANKYNKSSEHVYRLSTGFTGFKTLYIFHNLCTFEIL